MIHKSHSKKELCDIIKTFEIDIDQPETMKKKQLVKRLSSELDIIDIIKPELDRYVFYNLIDLKEFLGTCNPKKRLTIKQKNDVILDCRKIQQYIKSDYIVKGSSFSSIEDIHELATSLLHAGDIPSVRRMCRDLNKDPKTMVPFHPLLSRQTKRELEIRENLKKRYSQKLEVKTGYFALSFS